MLRKSWKRAPFFSCDVYSVCLGRGSGRVGQNEKRGGQKWDEHFHHAALLVGRITQYVHPRCARLFLKPRYVPGTIVRARSCGVHVITVQ